MSGATRFLLLLATPFSLLQPHRSSSSLYRLGRLSFRPISSSLTPPHNTNTLSPQPPQHHLTIKSSQRALHAQSNSLKDDHYAHHHHNHPWPEWSKLIQNLSPAADVHGILPEDAFVSYEYLSEEFVRAASSCLVFARNRPDILGLLSRKDIEVVVENGTPFLFKSALDTGRRMRSFLGLGSTAVNVLESSNAQTVDLVKYLLSYANNPTVSPEKNKMYDREHIEASVRNLLNELADASCRVPGSDLSTSGHQGSGFYGQTSRPLGPNIEMKRGDWICSRCSFMNFARNVKCLECEQPRPKRQLTGGEWECPQCDFFNYGRNTVCLRCDCKHPGEASVDSVNSGSGLGFNNGNNAKGETDSRLAANEEKAQRWFSKLNNGSDLNNAATDEDFPEIMPLRKGENRFVVSTRKTPLERRLANSQYKMNRGNDSQSFGRSSTFSETDDKNTGRQNYGTVRTTVPRTGSMQDVPPKGSYSEYKPFVPLPPDMFAKKALNPNMEVSENSITRGMEPVPSNSLDQKDPVSVMDESRKSFDNFQQSKNVDNEVQSENEEKQQAEKSERWFKRVAELHDVPDLASSISDEDFPEIMPMRKGENRFVVSKKKDRSLTSPMYKRQMAAEQANNTKFVPFVPFPPDYFAKKDKQDPESTNSTAKPIDKAELISRSAGMNSVISDDIRRGEVNLTKESSVKNQQTDGENWNSNSGAPAGGIQTQVSPAFQATNNGSWSSSYSGKDNIARPRPSVSPDQTTSSYRSDSNESWSGRNYGKESSSRTGSSSFGNSTQSFTSNQPSSNTAGTTLHSTENHNIKTGWTGKSLEGSAVKEPDPLDMSEEAKAERWFRRVAQIKDISELSQIPDEDFPSIMPMRKGVNRFVVSKRKTPLERRLTSPQYRRNLPVVSSEPVKEDNDNS